LKPFITVLLHQLDGSQDPQVVVSYISDTEPPALTSNAFTITDTPLPGSSSPATGGLWAWAPGCSSPCVGSFYPDWIQHAGVFKGPKSGNSYLITSDAWSLGANNSYGHYVIYNLTTNTSTIINIANGQQQTNVLGAEAVMPYSSFNGDDDIFLIWSSTASNFYPGVQYDVYDIQSASIVSSASYGGTATPNSCPDPDHGNCPANRLFDFMNGAEPIKGTAEAFFNGFVALLNSPDSLGLYNSEGGISVVTNR
jgi:hypothetical protein